MDGWHWFGTLEGGFSLLRSVYTQCTHEPFSFPATCEWCWADVIRGAVEIEREAVVAFLRRKSADYAAGERFNEATGTVVASATSRACKAVLALEADAIERGEHRG